jgi:hypothetical protein
MTVYNYGKFQAGGEWRNPSILYSPHLEDQIMLRVKTGDANCTIDSLVEFIAGAGAAADLITATICGDESLVCMAQIVNNEWNKNQLAVDNSVDTYYGLTKGTATFASGTYIDVVILMPGMIMNGKLADSTVVAPGTNLKPAASGKVGLLDVSANDEPAIRIGASLSVSTSVASLQWIAWKVSK